MAEELPSLHIDTDWKKQAQEEKRKLAEAAAKAKPSEPKETPTALPSTSARSAKPEARGRGTGKRALPPPGFPSLVQSMMTQVLYYLGDIGGSASAGGIDLDMAKYQLDTLGMLEEKTQNNLSTEEKTLLDAALYETRSRFISVASQFLGP